MRYQYFRARIVKTQLSSCTTGCSFLLELVLLRNEPIFKVQKRHGVAVALHTYWLHRK